MSENYKNYAKEEFLNLISYEKGFYLLSKNYF